MIRVRIVVDEDGVLSSISMTGHAPVEEDAGVSVVCAAVTSVVRAVAQAIDAGTGVSAIGSARRPGEFAVEIRAVADDRRAWLAGVTDVMIAGIARIEREAPEEVALSINTTGDTDGT